MNILGLDMATKKSGYSIFKDNKLCQYGLIEISDDNVGYIEEIKEILINEYGYNKEILSYLFKWQIRSQYMKVKVIDIIKNNNIDKIICEDVTEELKNASTLKWLSVLQGLLTEISINYNIPIIFFSPDQWRRNVEIDLYYNENGKKKRKQREQLKKDSIELANKTFGLELIWKSPTSKFNEDDIADAINIAYSQIIDKKSFGRK